MLASAMQFSRIIIGRQSDNRADVSKYIQHTSPATEPASDFSICKHPNKQWSWLNLSSFVNISQQQNDSEFCLQAPSLTRSDKQAFCIDIFIYIFRKCTVVKPCMLSRVSYICFVLTDFL